MNKRTFITNKQAQLHHLSSKQLENSKANEQAPKPSNNHSANYTRKNKTAPIQTKPKSPYQSPIYTKVGEKS